MQNRHPKNYVPMNGVPSVKSWSMTPASAEMQRGRSTTFDQNETR